MLGKIALLASALVVPPLVAAAPAGAATGDVSGTVSAYGSVLAGVPVKAYSVPADDGDEQVLLAQTVTDGSGHYTLTPGAPAALICFESPSYVAECWQDVYQDEGDPASYGTAVDTQAVGGVTGINATLIAGGTISGGLYRNDTGTPVVGTVNATSDEHFFYNATEADGSYSLTHLPPGSYRVCGWGTNLLQICEQREVTDGSVSGNTDFFFEPRPPVFAATAGGADRVTWSWNPVAGATGYRIAVSTSPTMAKAKVRYVDGRYATFTGLTKGTTYYAAVRAYNITQTTAASPVFRARPGWVVGLRLWNASDRDLVVRSGTYVGAAKYQFRLSSTPTFSGYRSLTASEPLVQFFNLEPSTTYYLQVRAQNKAGSLLTGWSSTVAMKTYS